MVENEKTTKKNLFTSESVTEGHPDKMCDQISDAILDACLSQDPHARVACECLITTNKLIIAGEITTSAKVNYEKIAREKIIEIWFDSEEKYFDGNSCDVEVLIHTQSPDIALWVDIGWAGDQGIMFGYATNETESMLPVPIDVANKLARQLSFVRKNWTLSYLRPDGKTQVTIRSEEGKSYIDTIVISTQHSKDVTQEQLRKDIIHFVVNPILKDAATEKIKFYINPTWSFVIGWPMWDTGVTWRKIIVDTYGGMGRHGWGAFSWKDPTKVDRSAAYVARYLAKNIVSSGICDKCEIQLAYAIWVAQPVSISLECFGTEKTDIEKIINTIYENFDLSPTWIIEKLDLRTPIYSSTAAYGHFWKPELPWEKTDSVEIFKKTI